VISVADHKIVGHVKQDSPFCPNIAATPDGKQVWFTLKDTGRTEVFNAKPPFDGAQGDRYRTDHQSRQHRPATPTARSPMSPSVG
jgi:DNA-binding beta-propeller fold protein YncE